MSVPVLFLVAGPNGAGKTTYYEEVLRPSTGLPFINADVIAKERWPEAQAAHAYEAARIAAEAREAAMRAGKSFITETVFSHPSKLDLLKTAGRLGYRRYLNIILIPEELAVMRVRARVLAGGHQVPEEKIRQRFKRLWRFLGEALEHSEEALILDNASAKSAFQVVARFEKGGLVGSHSWPSWAPEEVRKHFP